MTSKVMVPKAHEMMDAAFPWLGCQSPTMLPCKLTDTGWLGHSTTTPIRDQCFAVGVPVTETTVGNVIIWLPNEQY